MVTPVPIGLGYLSHALKTRRGDETLIVDGRRERLSAEAIVARAREFGADAIGVTSMTYESPQALALIERFKEALPDTPVIMGGPHVTGYGPSLLARTRADYLILGEGEDALVELLDALEGGGDLSAIGGLARRDGAEVGYAGARTTACAVEGVGIDWAAVRPEEYFSFWRRNAMNTVAKSDRRLPTFFTRGCPFGCSYCHQIFGRQYRSFPVERVVDEMVMLRDRYRVREFEIIDDTFNLKLDYAKAAMAEIVKRKLGCALAFANGLRADRMDEELLDLMEAAGVYRVDYAIESASPRIQSLIHKKLDLERAREIVDMTAARGIVTGCYYMLGFPTETEEEMEATVEYALSLKNHVASFFYLMPFPGTEIAESDPQLAARLRESVFPDASRLTVNLSAAPDEAVERIKRKAYRNFYFSPARVYRVLRDVPKNPRLIASAIAALRLSFQEEVNY